MRKWRNTPNWLSIGLVMLSIPFLPQQAELLD
jgi:hypothetical protein